jgi:hypothetical protein
MDAYEDEIMILKRQKQLSEEHGFTGFAELDAEEPQLTDELLGKEKETSPSAGLNSSNISNRSYSASTDATVGSNPHHRQIAPSHQV